MPLLRDEIERLEQNGITRIALTRLNDPKVLPLWFGEGDRPTPAFIREAAKEALDRGDTFYTYTRGKEELRDSLKTYLDRLYGIDINPARVSVPGATMLGITIAAQMALTTGDHGIIVSPNWPNITNTFEVTGAEYSYVRKREAGGRWHLDLEELYAAVRPNTKAIFVNTPCNPTGWVMSSEEQGALLAFCRERDILIIADEVYHRNIYEGDVAPSFITHATDDDPLIIVNGFSKAWAMTGWRLGWMVAPARYATHIAVLSECFNTGATVFVQTAAIAALERGEAWVSELREQYRQGRDMVMAVLGAHPRVEIIEPQGAFYAFVRIKDLASSWDFAKGLLDEEDVGIAPGYTFGPGNEDYCRLCFALSLERLSEVLARIIRYLDRQDHKLSKVG